MKNNIVIVLVFFFFSCQKEEKASFKTFEISYTDGWLTEYSFLIDSTGKYYCKRLVDYPSTGKLSDSIFNKVNLFAKDILQNKYNDSIGNECFDCSIIGLKIKAKDRIIVLDKKYYTDKKLYEIVKPLEFFFNEGKHKEVDTIIYFETEKAIAPPMPLPYSEYKKRMDSLNKK